jgi:hypothetical protein
VPDGPVLAWFHCFSGIAGDMALGSLIDAGADVDEVRALCRRLPVPGWELEVEPVLRGGIAATRAVVRWEPTTVVRTYSHIVGLIEEARLPHRVRERALATFTALARAEGRLHRRPMAQVHFHEVGAIDSIVDIVGTCAALEVLGVDDVRSSPVTTGTGTIRAAHGVLPNPPPAVVALLEGVPTHGVDIGIELTTPTGAALLAALCTGWGPMPAMTVTSSGFGAGSHDLKAQPNSTQVVIGRAAAAPSGDGQPVVLLEANVDDVTGETLGHAVAQLLAAGAHDAWVTPIVMKKGRPAHTVHALADVAAVARITDVLVHETGTLGVRGTRLERWPAPRSFAEVDVEGLAVRVKVSPGRVKAEHDDAVRVAARTGLPLREVVARAEDAWRRQQAPAAPPAPAVVPVPPPAGA